MNRSITIIALLIISLPIPLLAMKATDIYMLKIHGNALAADAIKNVHGWVNVNHISSVAVEKAFKEHQFVNDDKTLNPFVIEHTIRIADLVKYEKEGVSPVINRILSAMYIEDVVPAYLGKNNLDKSRFKDFDTKYLNGIVRRVGNYTYGEKLKDGIIRLMAFFYSADVLTQEDADSDDSDECDF